MVLAKLDWTKPTNINQTGLDQDDQTNCSKTDLGQTDLIALIQTRLIRTILIQTKLTWTKPAFLAQDDPGYTDSDKTAWIQDLNQTDSDQINSNKTD